jgi:hypothetical protein
LKSEICYLKSEISDLESFAMLIWVIREAPGPCRHGLLRYFGEIVENSCCQKRPDCGRKASSGRSYRKSGRGLRIYRFF